MKRTITIEHNGVVYTAEPMIIKSTRLGVEDHGIFTAYLVCQGNGCGISVGGYALDRFDDALDRRKGTAYGLDHILEILRVVGVGNWEDLAGREIYILSNGSLLGNVAIGIAHPIEDRVLIFKDHADRWRENAEGEVS